MAEPYPASISSEAVGDMASALLIAAWFSVATTMRAASVGFLAAFVWISVCINAATCTCGPVSLMSRLLSIFDMISLYIESPADPGAKLLATCARIVGSGIYRLSEPPPFVASAVAKLSDAGRLTLFPASAIRSIPRVSERSLVTVLVATSCAYFHDFLPSSVSRHCSLRMPARMRFSRNAVLYSLSNTSLAVSFAFLLKISSPKLLPLPESCPIA